MGDTDLSNMVTTNKTKLEHIEKDIDGIHGFNQKMIEVSANQTASLERIHERLDEWSEQTKAIIELGSSVRNMALESKENQETLKTVMSIMQDQHMRIRDIEMKKYEERFKEIQYQIALEKESAEIKINLLKDKIITLENRAGSIALKYLDKVFGYLLIGLVATILVALGYYAAFKLGGK